MMNQKKKIEQLQKIIIESLSQLIDRDYYLLELPYYTNIGDTLIWQGELDFLKRFHYKCKGMYSLETFPFFDIPDNSLIIFHGGGNFGDLWEKHHNFKMEVIRRYPNNKFIFFPQTVFFQDEEKLKKCAKFLCQFNDVTICARDKRSYQILSECFNNHILLVPDMAFCIKRKMKNNVRTGEKELLLKRIDKEYLDTTFISDIELRENVDVSDWPTLNKLDKATKLMLRLRDSHKIPKFLADIYAYLLYRRHLIDLGRNLLSSYKKIYSTRLHAAILGILMHKEVIIIDNTYGKNKSFYETWLYDCENVKFITE